MARGEMRCYIKSSHGFEWEKNNFYNSFGDIPKVHHKIKNGCLDGNSEAI